MLWTPYFFHLPLKMLLLSCKWALDLVRELYIAVNWDNNFPYLNTKFYFAIWHNPSFLSTDFLSEMVYSVSKVLSSNQLCCIELFGFMLRHSMYPSLLSSVSQQLFKLPLLKEALADELETWLQCLPSKGP